MALRCTGIKALSSWSPTAKPSHIGFGARLIDKD